MPITYEPGDKPLTRATTRFTRHISKISCFLVILQSNPGKIRSKDSLRRPELLKFTTKLFPLLPLLCVRLTV